MCGCKNTDVLAQYPANAPPDLTIQAMTNEVINPNYN